MYQDIRVINEMVQAESRFIEQLKAEIAKVIVGQEYMVDRLLIGLLSDGHILLEGVPGLAKTLTVKTLADCVQTKFQRIQFTPDLLPADIVGTLIYNQRENVFIPKKGPIFTNFVLADEINRAPAKVQSALLEAMQERQVTIGDTTYPLAEPFLVLATQNPIEQEGTYPLPEAQIDGFMLKIKISYPTRQEELQITERMAGGAKLQVNPVVTPDDILKARSVVNQVYLDDKIKNYMIDIVFATRDPKQYKLEELAGMIEYGASPRASIYLYKAARAHAFLKRRGYVIPEDVKAVGLDILRHRVILSYEAEAEERTSEDIIKQIFDTIEVP
jgi:MoxR-like ATPase